MRNFLRVVSGLVIGIIVINLIDMLGELAYPSPSYLDYSNKDTIMKLVLDAPFGAQLFIPLSWAFGSFSGGVVSSLISNNQKINMALITGFILMIAGLTNLITFPHHVWVWIVGLSVYLPFAYLGAKLGTKMSSKEKSSMYTTIF